jgi:hypothetical protein
MRFINPKTDFAFKKMYLLSLKEKLIEGKYQLQSCEPDWMPEVSLGLGRYQVKLREMTQEQLAWFWEI